MKNIPQYILELLQKERRAIVSGFGTFVVKTSGAQLDVNKKSILPPSQFLDFKEDFSISDVRLQNFIADKKNVPLQAVEQELHTQVEFWKKKIAVKEQFNIAELGSFIFEDHTMQFKGDRLPSDLPDYFGLEEIVFSEIQSKKEAQTSAGVSEVPEYTFSKNILWIFLLIIPVFAIIYFAVANKELLFGKKSFNDISVKNATHRIQNPVKKTFTPSDSLKMDTLKSTP